MPGHCDCDGSVRKILLEFWDLWKSDRSPGCHQAPALLPPKIPAWSKGTLCPVSLSWAVWSCPGVTATSCMSSCLGNGILEEQKSIPWGWGSARAPAAASMAFSMESQQGLGCVELGAWKFHFHLSKNLQTKQSTLSTGISSIPISSASPSPAAPSYSPFHFPLTKEKSFCFWLIKVLMVQASGLKTQQMETTPDQ